jgi:hypothetical protein
MTLTVQLSSELVEALRALAGQRGQELDRTIEDLLEAQLHQQTGAPALLPRDETELLLQINQGLPSATWERYHALKRKRDVRTLTPDEHAELLALTNEVEQWNACRVELVAALPRLRQVPLRVMMDELGLSPPPYA